jgi:hypothetical protein
VNRSGTVTDLDRWCAKAKLLHLRRRVVCVQSGYVQFRALQPLHLVSPRVACFCASGHTLGTTGSGIEVTCDGLVRLCRPRSSRDQMSGHSPSATNSATETSQPLLAHRIRDDPANKQVVSGQSKHIRFQRMRLAGGSAIARLPAGSGRRHGQSSS